MQINLKNQMNSCFLFNLLQSILQARITELDRMQREPV